MRDELLKFLAPREETIEIACVKCIVREVAQSADTSAFVDGTDVLYKFIVRCVFGADGKPAFTDDDIPALKAAGRVRLSELASAVGRVNGWDTADDVKNSAAGPSAG